jgi:hypothetical protein
MVQGYNVLDAFDAATYSTMKKPSSFTSLVSVNLRYRF